MVFTTLVLCATGRAKIPLWDFSLFLEVPFAVSVARLAQRDGSDPDPEAPSQRRYVQGQQIYLQRCEPWRWARVVLDNSDLAAPYFNSLFGTI